ncbi:hypothetical protein OPT61_g8786 [Boeremia exigua]|uniref:Uncharacterized protein n=1 Tax=Boeremia exigua TaxID=749465 RepID=A0ACC2HWR9_9PLEO|nr:hypothetical protein OPT61_g8786 [Boeremia exigua]
MGDRHQATVHNPPTQEQSRASASNTCQRCDKIPWEDLRSDWYHELIIVDSIYALQQSQCRICRLLGHYLLLRTSNSPIDQVITPTSFHRIPGPHCISSYEVNRKDSFSTITPDDMLPDKQGRSIFRSEVRLPVAQILVDENAPYLSYKMEDLHPPTLDVGQIKDWVTFCERYHKEQCKTHPADDIKELKLIDCQESKVICAQTVVSYVALSYVWGNVDSCAISSGPDLLSGAPQTIIDAVQLTKDLGYRYLWVDRYCIDQQDTDVKHIQIAQMGDVYAGAVLTIIALTSSNPNSGLPGVSTNFRGVRTEALGSFHVSVIPATRDILKISLSPWAKRAWTFQECVLSKRRLFLMERQAIFVCNTHTCFEAKAEADFQGNIDRFEAVGWLPPRGLTSKADPLKTALTYLTAYSERALSYDTDALNGILGALNALRKDTIHQIWGLPFKQSRNSELQALKSTENSGVIYSGLGEEFGLPLAWRHWSAARRRRPGFPSWSPLGWEGAIKFWELKLWEFWTTSIPVTVQPSGFMTPTSEEALRLHSLVLSDAIPTDVPQQLVLHGETYVSPVSNDFGIALPFSNDLYYRVFVHWSISPSMLGVSHSIKCLLVRAPSEHMSVTRDWMLLLRPSGTTDPITYERIGFAILNAGFTNGLRSDSFLSLLLDADLQPLSDDSAALEKFEDPDYIASQGTWWRRHFTSEIVTLV